MAITLIWSAPVVAPGRVVTKDFGDNWEVYRKGIKLEKIFARDDIKLPAGTMLVYDAPKERKRHSEHQLKLQLGVEEAWG